MSKKNPFTNAEKQENIPEKLRQAVLTNDIKTICAIIEDNKGLVKYTYEGQKTILLIACSRNGVKPETVQHLLQADADPRYFTKTDGWEALHWAARSTNYEILNILLETHPETINTVDLCDRNCLHILIQYGKKTSTDFQRCIELLVNKGVDVNQKTFNGKTPFDWALQEQLSNDIKDILKNQVSNNNLEVDDYRNFKDYLKRNDIEGFINFKNGNVKDLVNYKDESYTLLQMSCEKGLVDAAKHLLNNGAELELTSPKNNSKPIIIAAKKGYMEVFEAVLDKYEQILKIPQDVLPTILKNIDDKEHNTIGCYNIFIEKMKEKKDANPDDVSFKISEGDKDENTPLHYAVLYAEQNVVEELLSLGALLGARNAKGIMPIENIETETLNNHLDKCVEFDLKKRKTDNDEFKVTFNYRTLIPPCVQLKDISIINEDINVQEPFIKKEETKLVAETEVIRFMSESSELKDLLTHPTITSFIYLKWLKIQRIFWLNLSFYLFFAASIVVYFILYILVENSNNSHIMFHIPFTLAWLAILLKVIFQIVVARAKYFRHFENKMEILLMISSANLIYHIYFSNELKKDWFAIIVLLVAFELILMMNPHPMFSTKVVMYKTISYNYFKYLIWYSVPVLAFALSFHLVFSNNISIHTDASNKNNSFDNLSQSLLKTVIMFTGEFDYGNLSFDQFPVARKLIIAAFVFTMALVFLNLLNALAISDIQEIRSDAEVVGYIEQIQFINGIESMLIENSVVLKYIRKLITMKYIPIDLKSYICIFPINFKYKVQFFPRKDGLVKDESFGKVYLDGKTVSRTNNIIQKERKNQQNQKQ